MPDDLSFLDQLEEWLDSQVPNNLHELPYKMLETMEKVTNELFETLNIHGPPSISIPFPPFGGKEAPPPPPPPTPLPLIPLTGLTSYYHKSEKIIRKHPYLAGTALTVGLGLTGLTVYKYSSNLSKLKNEFKLKRKFGIKGRVEDGMLKEAIVILAPSPMPPILIALAASLLRAGYIVLVAVPKSKDADQLERRLSGLEEKSALRVLIYDPDDTTTFPPFHRSLLATLTLRFPQSGKYASGDPYNPSPTHLPHIHAFLSLYPLIPSPPTQPGGLPALPTLLAPNQDGTTPMLVNFYPSTSVLTTPDTFASQVLTTNHQLLGKNLAVSSNSKILSVYVGDINLPSLPAILSGSKQLTRRQAAKEKLLANSSPIDKASIIKDYFLGSISSLYGNVIGPLGFGNKIKSYENFEIKLLVLLKSSFFNNPFEKFRAYNTRNNWFIGSRSFLPYMVSKFNLPPIFLPKILNYLPILPLSSTGPCHPLLPKSYTTSSDKNMNSDHSASRTPRSATSSNNSSDHEGGNDDLISSTHTGTTNTSNSTSNSSRNGYGDNENENEGDGSGLEGSWVGLDSNN
ncbi:uncharacterized protein L201_004360 [Kwoniella dendrophila CBS 6074]|uniref:DUF1776-domain-containing protein n=1 Tax=Kwoniella dendrophila CBS 6074 TaxID=1295534 RepID=A0AAX4JVY6_9TREE